MKYFVCICAMVCMLFAYSCMLSCNSLYAEDVWSIKAGYRYVDCFAVDSSPTLSGAYEYKDRYFGGEIMLSADSCKIRSVGRIVAVSGHLIGKFYPWKEDLFIGGGLGYTYNSFIEEYDYAEADIDDEVSYQFVAGHRLNKKVSVEVFYIIEDIDIETGIPHETPIEQHSRKDSAGIRLVYRW